LQRSSLLSLAKRGWGWFPKVNQESIHIRGHRSEVAKSDRQKFNRHGSAILWFTGLSGSGKSTIAYQLEENLFRKGVRTYVLDGDNIRSRLNRDLGFSMEDREENIRRIGEVAKLFVDAGMVVLTAFISPYRKDRAIVRSLVEGNEFVEIYVKCPLEICEERDTKGFYEKARRGIIKQFTGIDDPYEEPENPEIVIETDKMSIGECVGKISDFLEAKRLVHIK
jgi:adenylylsulfate kinase